MIVHFPLSRLLRSVDLRIYYQSTHQPDRKPNARSIQSTAAKSTKRCPRLAETKEQSSSAVQRRSFAGVHHSRERCCHTAFARLSKHRSRGLHSEECLVVRHTNRERKGADERMSFFFFIFFCKWFTELSRVVRLSRIRTFHCAFSRISLDFPLE